jgi:CelD/BcsL family acetyltransferase involved in cellulose biosynthesis
LTKRRPGAVAIQMRVQFYHDFAVLPCAYGPLFEDAGRRQLCLTRPWFQCLAANTLSEAEQLCLIGVEGDGPDHRPLALLVARHRERDGEAGAARTLSGLSTVYTMVFGPQLAPAADGSEVLATLFDALRARQPRYDMLRFQPLERDGPEFHALLEALRTAGFVAQPFFHFGNWYEESEAVDFHQYLARRPSALRHLLERRGRRLAAMGPTRFEVITEVRDLDRAVGAYERVYARSWKRSEPYPRLIGELMGLCARVGALRLGLLYLRDEPVAAQFWMLWNRRATIYKLAHDERFDQASPGSLLTARMMEYVLARDRPVEVDFGAGDDPFKRTWLSRRRERWGIAAFDPRTPRGVKGILRHVVGGRVRRAVLNCAP